VELEAVAAALDRGARRRRAEGLDAVALALRVKLVDRQGVGGGEIDCEQARLALLAQGQQMVVAAGAAQIHDPAVRRDLVEAPHVAIELRRLGEIAHAELDAAHPDHSRVGHDIHLSAGPAAGPVSRDILHRSTRSASKAAAHRIPSATTNPVVSHVDAADSSMRRRHPGSDTMADQPANYQPIRRIVTGHDAGKVAKVLMDGPAGNVRFPAPGTASCTVWCTDETPADVALGERIEDFGARELTIPPPANGSRFGIVDFAPGNARFMHRTETIDYVIVM